MQTRVLSLLAVVALACAAAPARAADVAPPRPTPATLPGDDEIFRTIEEVTAFSPRRVGTPGLERTVQYIASKYRAFGLSRVHIEETPTWSWTALRHGLTVAGQAIDASPVTYSQSPSRTFVGDSSTPAGGLRAPLVDVGLATAADVRAHDVKGKIAVFDLKFLLPLAGLLPVSEFLWDPQSTLLLSPQTLIGANPYITTFSDAVKAAQDAGAVGFVGVLADYFGSNRYYNEFYRKLVVKIPGLWVTKAEGARIRSLMAAHPGAPAQLDFASRRAKVKAHAVVGYLDGRSTDAIMVQSHHDSGYTGAVEDGSGVSEVLALAKHFGAQGARKRAKTLMFVTFDSHWSGYHAHFAFTRRHITHRDPAREPNRIVANVTLEHIAKAASTGSGGRLEVSGLPEPRGIFENVSIPLKQKLIDAVVRNDLQRTAILNGALFQAVGIPTDASAILAGGVPTLSLISGPLYLYDAADTLDKVDKDELGKVAQAFAEVIDDLDATPSDSIGIVPPSIADPLGVRFIDDLGGERGTEESVDRVECAAATSGRAVAAARLRRSGSRTVLGFRARRSGPVRITVRHRGGRSVRLSRPTRVRACRRYAITLPGSVVAADIVGRGGAAHAGARR